jgi:hypothetical protein
MHHSHSLNVIIVLIVKKCYFRALEAASTSNSNNEKEISDIIARLKV